MISFFDLPGTQDVRLSILDVGAMNLGEEIYAPLLELKRGAVLGFEPVPEECEKLNAAGTSHRYLPYAVGDGRRRRFHICNYPMTSSLFPPNTELLDLYQNLGELVRVVREVEVKTVRLDDIPEARETDFLKMDVQGAELDILLGAPVTLTNAVVVHTEVEFVPLYNGQPLFAEVDQELRRRGFYFHRFHSMMGRPIKPLLRDNNPNASMGQVLWGDAVYVRDPLRLDELSPVQLLKLGAVMHEVYKSYDYVSRVLAFHDKATGSRLYMDYLTRLTGQPQPEAVLF